MCCAETGTEAEGFATAECEHRRSEEVAKGRSRRGLRRQQGGAERRRDVRAMRREIDFSSLPSLITLG